MNNSKKYIPKSRATTDKVNIQKLII